MTGIEGKSPLVISRLESRDVREISEILVSMDPWLTLGYQPDALAHYLLRADPALSRYSVCVSERLAGVFSVRFPWLFGPFIELIALFEASRGQGTGTRLIEWISKEFPAPNLWTTVSSFNLAAREFYQKRGFVQTAVVEDLIKPGRQEILLRRRSS